MKYIYILLLLMLYIYPLNFAKFSWKRKQYLPCIGMVALVIIAFVLPVALLMTR